jgi:hypothetical protein
VCWSRPIGWYGPPAKGAARNSGKTGHGNLGTDRHAATLRHCPRYLA